jgi:ribosome-associated translation inhibitor RaiA
MRISSFLRPELTLVAEGSSVDEAARRMIQKHVSNVIIVAGKKPLGVLSALDIFKKVQELAHEGVPIAISGLREETRGQYPHIRNKIGHALDKFSRTFNIRNASVHVKEGKSTFVVNVYFDIDKGHVSLKEERSSLKETVDEIASELNKVLRKKKEMRRMKPRVSHAR